MSHPLAARAEALGRHAGLFALPGRGVIELRGADRVLWLNGMISNDVAALEAAGPGAGCYALVLTRQGRIVTDLHVLLEADRLLLETATAPIPEVIAGLEKYVIADDVELRDCSASLLRMAVEGPAALASLEAAGAAVAELAPEHFRECRIADAAVIVAAYAFTGRTGYQLIVPAESAAAVEAALLAADPGLVAGDAELFELLRVEAGLPLAGSELDESVLPAEARLERAVSTTKGCYTGQEVVARLRSRDRVNHLLVGLRFAGDEPAAPGSALEVEGKRVGELTSALRSPRFGAIGLGFVARAHSEPGAELAAGGLPARVCALPFGTSGAADVEAGSA